MTGWLRMLCWNAFQPFGNAKIDIACARDVATRVIVLAVDLRMLAIDWIGRCGIFVSVCILVVETLEQG